MELQIGTTLQNGKYTIIKKLGNGGFGITYLAKVRVPVSVSISGSLGTFNTDYIEAKVTIKEFFLKDFCNREETSTKVTITSNNIELVGKCRWKFIEEAHKISNLHHPHIVKVSDVFDENGTSYYVMEYLEGGSLVEKVGRDGLPEQLATCYILQVANALSYIHRHNMLHLDVKPGNIMLDREGNAKLIDFGLTKQYDKSTGGEITTTPVGRSDGYSPSEQYDSIDKFSPETDIYSLGATFFKLLTGMTPPNASEVLNNGVPVDVLKVKKISSTAINTICKAMEPCKKERYKKVDTFIDSLRPVMTLQKGLKVFEIVLEKQKYKTLDFMNYSVNGVSFTMRKVESGNFTRNEMGKLKIFSPMHDYYIGTTCVTQTLYKAVMGIYHQPYFGEKHPVSNLSWDDCFKFITRLNEITRKNFRLPSEIEWEFAARGGNLSKGYLYSGSNVPREIGWCEDEWARREYWGLQNMEILPKILHDVSTLKPNELGIYDMNGSVCEWCSAPYIEKVADSSFHFLRGGDSLSAPWPVDFGKEASADKHIGGIRLALDTMQEFRVTLGSNANVGVFFTF